MSGTVPEALRAAGWRTAGLCSQCGGIPIEGRKLCRLHTAKAQRANLARKLAAPTPVEARKLERVEKRIVEKRGKWEERWLPVKRLNVKVETVVPVRSSWLVGVG